MDMKLVADEIQQKITHLDKCKKSLLPVSQKKAEKTAEYELILAKTIIALRNGRQFELDGERVVDPPVSVMEKIARGLCWESKLAMDKAEGENKSLLKTIDIIESQLNGFQSINRHQMEV